MKLPTIERIALILSIAAISGVAGIVLLFFLLDRIGAFL